MPLFDRHVFRYLPCFSKERKDLSATRFVVHPDLVAASARSRALCSTQRYGLRGNVSHLRAVSNPPDAPLVRRQTSCLGPRKPRSRAAPGKSLALLQQRGTYITERPRQQLY